MQHKISGEFATRRAAELAVERLVQEHGIDRTAVAVAAQGSANSAGSKAAGADTESGHPGVDKHGDPKLGGPIAVTVACRGDDAQRVETAMKDAGAERISTR